MLREQCKVGMSVTFGRTRGEKTVGVVEKCNPSKAKVRTTEARGQTPAGTIWNVPYSLLAAVGDVVPPLPRAFPIGLTIVGVRGLTKAEHDAEGWPHGPHSCVEALALSDGSVIYASRDYEGNGPGALYARKGDGESLILSPVEASHA